MIQRLKPVISYQIKLNSEKEDAVFFACWVLSEFDKLG